MCLIIAVSARAPDPSLLDTAQQFHGDGIGVAWLEKGSVHWTKGLNLERLKAAMPGFRPPYTIHFRQATVGGRSARLCHPFPISRSVPLDLKGHGRLVLFHNGHIAEWRDMILHALQRPDVKLPAGEWSDSRVVAFLCSVYGLGFLHLIEGINKFATLSRRGIVLYGQWYEREGYWLSNTFHEESSLLHFRHTLDYPGYSAHRCAPEDAAGHEGERCNF